MNKIIIANYRETEPQVISREGNSFAVKPVIREADAGKCAASFVEVEPGRYAYGYHYHEVNEDFTSSGAMPLCVRLRVKRI